MDLASLFDLLASGLVRGGIYALMAVGLALVFGVMNIAQFAHGEFYMIGAYASFFGASVLGLHPILAMLFATAVGFVAGAIVERAAFLPLRRRSEEWVMNAFLVTVGLSFVLQNGALFVLGPNYRGVTQYFDGSIPTFGGMSISYDRVAAFVFAIIAIGLLWLFLQRTATGRAIRAVAQDERGAMLVGISLSRIHVLTFGLSTALAALAGAALLSLTQAYPSVGYRPLIESWFVVMLVGLGNIEGSIIGGFLVGMLESLSYYYVGANWQPVVTVVVLILVLLLKPSGLFGSEVKGVWER